MALIAGGVVLGGCMAVVYALQAPTLEQFASMVGATAAFTGAALLVGGLLGFLFGIPRTLQRDLRRDASRNGAHGDASAEPSRELSYQANTNLEQISDWLTKILVGVGLTQTSTIKDALWRFSEHTISALGGFKSNGLFFSALLVYFLVSGFLLSYLWTRLYFAGELQQADLAASLGGKLKQVENKVNELENQSLLDAKALSLVQRQLNPALDSSPVSQEELNAALKAASCGVRAQSFYLAQSVRRENWREPEDKPKMERTIPIFRALIAVDAENVEHTTHAQFGFALKDQRKPDWAEAEAELTRAIEIRGDWRERGWLLYEFNRALCRIRLDPGFNAGKSSDAAARSSILADLQAAAHDGDLLPVIAQEPSIQQWMLLNSVDNSTLANA
ncbi:hypothetical protein F0U60_17005 [Archangium minus]|uniref:HemY N-terminal domain-containing protein n=1 Tax=Archangium minus TaxID=83450 RepID=A0ABY9WP80_9BACT|nr:hypothetical protein F0U60_17005 [Archangium minus]